jgi:hypothetical protein
MLIQLIIACREGRREAIASHRTLDVGCGFEAVEREFPSVELVSAPRAAGPATALGIPFADVETGTWRDRVESAWILDAHVAELDASGAFALRIEGERDELADVALQALTRYQYAVRRTNAASRTALFARLLDAYTQLVDADTPAARALRVRGLDTWQWLLRLYPEASLGAQLTALLLHATAGDRRVHRAVLALLLDGIEREIDPGEIERALMLLDAKPASLSRLAPDAEALAVLDADTLSFLSLGAEALLRDRGRAHTRARVSRSFRRLRSTNRFYLATMRHEPAVDDMLYELMSLRGSAAALGG